MSSGDRPAPTFPFHVELVPPGLEVEVFEHAVAHPPRARAFTYVTRGMSARGSAELALTIVREEGDDPQGVLREPLDLLKALCERAERGLPTREGEFTELGAGLFGRGELRGLTYVAARPRDAIPLEPDTLDLVLLVADELSVAREFGPARVLSRLGAHSGAYPFPEACDRKRPSVASHGEVDASLLGSVPKLWLPGAKLLLADGVLWFELPKDGAVRLSRALDAWPSDVAPALLAAPHRYASASLVWHPGQAAPFAHGGPNGSGERITGGFCLLVPNQPLDGAEICEDGFAVTLTASTFARLRGSLESGVDLDLALPGTIRGFALRIAQAE